MTGIKKNSNVNLRLRNCSILTLEVNSFLKLYL